MLSSWQQAGEFPDQVVKLGDRHFVTM